MNTYEKKYKEALELARDYYKANLKLDKEDENLILEDIFPELKESEDEKIRKNLIIFINDGVRCHEFATINGIDPEKVIAWLEKQGEKKPIGEINGEDYGIDGLWHAQRILEKTLGEVEGYQSDDGILDHKAAITAVKKLYKQKPWSVEDTFKVQRICMYLDEAKKYYADITEVRECIDWLKSLKDRVQPKQEWSKGDEEMLTEIITDVKFAQERNPQSQMNQIIFEEETNWLKSLKQRIGG